MSSYKNQKIFKLLQTIALSGEKVGNVRIASAITYRGDIVAFGQNRYKSHPFQSRYSKNENSIYLHAETCAIHNALKKLSLDQIAKSSLYILRIKSDHSIGSSNPCMGCKKCIMAFGIKNVYYTNNNQTTFNKL
jgi:tRNA(Arg) A34 adenosine deaminase TadA